MLGFGESHYDLRFELR